MAQMFHAVGGCEGNQNERAAPASFSRWRDGGGVAVLFSLADPASEAAAPPLALTD